MELAEYELMYRIESRYWWFVGKRAHVLRLIRRWLRPPGPLRLLDVGCGTGANLAAFSGLGEATGCDIAPEAVEFCRRRGLARVVRQSSPDRLPFSDGQFDLVTALDVVEHVEDDVGMLRELRRVLKPGGALLLTVPAHPALWSVHDESLHHKRRYRKSLLLERLAAAGFERERTTYFNGFLLPLIVPVRLLRDRLTRRRGATSDFNLDLPGWLNASFLGVFLAERAWLDLAPLPFGLSLASLARRPLAP